MVAVIFVVGFVFGATVGAGIAWLRLTGAEDSSAAPVEYVEYAAGPEEWVDPVAGWESVLLEIERAGRHGHPCSLVRITPPWSTSWPAGTLESVRDELRIVDHAWIDDDGIHLLLPAADRSTAETCLSRLHARVPAVAAATGASIATYPDDGVTAGALSAELTREMETMAGA